MPIVNIGNLLDRVAAFEQQLGQYHAEIRDRSKDNGVRLLTYYLGRHRRHLPEILSAYSSQTIEHIRKIELGRDIPFVPEKEFHAIETPPDEVRGHELLEASVSYDTALVNLYGRILDQPLIAQAEELFESIIQVEKRDIVILREMMALYF